MKAGVWLFVRLGAKPLSVVLRTMPRVRVMALRARPGAQLLPLRSAPAALDACTPLGGAARPCFVPPLPPHAFGVPALSRFHPSQRQKPAPGCAGSRSASGWRGSRGPGFSAPWALRTPGHTRTPFPPRGAGGRAADAFPAARPSAPSAPNPNSNTTRAGAAIVARVSALGTRSRDAARHPRPSPSLGRRRSRVRRCAARCRSWPVAGRGCPRPCRRSSVPCHPRACRRSAKSAMPTLSAGRGCPRPGTAAARSTAHPANGTTPTATPHPAPRCARRPVAAAARKPKYQQPTPPSKPRHVDLGQTGAQDTFI